MVDVVKVSDIFEANKQLHSVLKHNKGRSKGTIQICIHLWIEKRICGEIITEKTNFKVSKNY